MVLGYLDGNDIILYNRDGINTKLRYIVDNKYLLITDLPTMGLTYSPTNKDEIVAVDPSGGPCLPIGSEVIDGMFVKNINYSKSLCGFIIELFRK